MVSTRRTISIASRAGNPRRLFLRFLVTNTCCLIVLFLCFSWSSVSPMTLRGLLSGIKGATNSNHQKVQTQGLLVKQAQQIANIASQIPTLMQGFANVCEVLIV